MLDKLQDQPSTYLSTSPNRHLYRLQNRHTWKSSGQCLYWKGFVIFLPIIQVGNPPATSLHWKGFVIFSPQIGWRGQMSQVRQVGLDKLCQISLISQICQISLIKIQVNLDTRHTFQRLLKPPDLRILLPTVSIGKVS